MISYLIYKYLHKQNEDIGIIGLILIYTSALDCGVFLFIKILSDNSEIIDSIINTEFDKRQSYEEVLEEGLQEALKLIEKKL